MVDDQLRSHQNLKADFNLNIDLWQIFRQLFDVNRQFKTEKLHWRNTEPGRQE